jgi:uncharacterized Tic20 family protein
MQPDPTQASSANQVQQDAQYGAPLHGQPVPSYGAQGGQVPPQGYGQVPPQGYGQVPPQGYPIPPPDRSMGTFAHIGGPLLGFFIPLILWAVTKDKAKAQDPLLYEHLQEAMNAGLTFLIAIFVHSLLAIVLIGCLTGTIHWILYLVWAIQANSALGRGERFHYPLTIRFITN